ncbi:MAG: hypothetical protein EOP38_05680 [Rubrivivax sp.]|nr:MAG: hypothetical protein EOP38_05680 [Rubrivivax sp.]
MTCIAPSLVLTTDAAREFGAIAEGVIATEYLRDIGHAAFFPAPPAMDFMDISQGFGNRSLYAAFLVSKHPGLSAEQLTRLSDNGLVKIPDLATFAPPVRSEFYEVKPNSSSGVAAGKVKIANIHALYQSLGLPYVPGMQWNPNTRITIFSGSLLGLEVDVYFHFFKLQPGLVVYEVCVEGRGRPLTNAEIAAVAAAVLIALIVAVYFGLAAAGGVLILA